MNRHCIPRYARDLTIGLPAPRHEEIVADGEWEHAVQAYLASTTFVDHCVGRVMTALEESEFANNTIVLLFSDHGWHLGEKGRWAKRSLWEDSTRVPLIVSGPGIDKGKTSPRPVGLIDVYPTLMELCGFPIDPSLDGLSLVPLLNDPNAPRDRPVLTTFGRGNHAVRSTRWRYIRYHDGSEELYDHEKDPNEWENLAGDPRFRSVIRAHAKWLPKTEKPVILNAKSSGLDAYLKAEAGK